jgi:hypothetical protein
MADFYSGRNITGSSATTHPSADLEPASNAVFNLGTSSLRWGTLYGVNINASGQVDVAGSINATGNITATGTVVSTVKQKYIARTTVGSITTGGSAQNINFEIIDANNFPNLTNDGAGTLTYTGSATLTVSVSAFVKILFNNTGARNFEINHSVDGDISGSYLSANGGSTHNVGASTICTLATGQSIKITLFQNSGSTLTFTGRIAMVVL